MATIALNSREVSETGNEPEFMAFDLDRWVDIGDGLIQVFVVSRRGKIDRMEYSFICAPDRLAYLCEKGRLFAAEALKVMSMKRRLSGAH